MERISKAEAYALDIATPSNNTFGIGSKLKAIDEALEAAEIKPPYRVAGVEVNVEADAATTPLQFTVEEEVALFDVVVLAKATAAAPGDGHVKIRLADDTTPVDITGTIEAKTDGAVSRAGTLVDAQTVLLPTETYEVVAGAADVRAKITILGLSR